ncbi:MAG: hypothetical protein IPG05_10520 [Gemmatimonadetes bacterium]|nr:hypothetical protein [Gemmatimonadota bacterium]
MVVDEQGSPVMHQDEAEAAAEAANDIHELEVMLRYGIPFNPVPGVASSTPTSERGMLVA